MARPSTTRRLAVRAATVTLAAAVAGIVVAPGAASAQAVPCDAVASYPGDAAAKSAIAQWMAYGAASNSLPRELPAMGALVESGLQNLPPGDDDRAGYFQMRVSIWNGVPAYAGFPGSPPLQRTWFLDRAAAVRTSRIGAGMADPAADENLWGAWIADVLLPPENERHRYQQRLLEARSLAGAPCAPVATPPPPPPPPPPPAPVVDTVAPLPRITGAGIQRPLQRGALVLVVACPSEACTTSATATIRLPGARRALRIALASRTTAAGQTRRLRLVLTRSARTRLRAALRRHPSVKATVRIVVSDLARNQVVRTRTVRLSR